MQRSSQDDPYGPQKAAMKAIEAPHHVLSTCKNPLRESPLHRPQKQMLKQPPKMAPMALRMEKTTQAAQMQSKSQDDSYGPQQATAMKAIEASHHVLWTCQNPALCASPGLQINLQPCKNYPHQGHSFRPDSSLRKLPTKDSHQLRLKSCTIVHTYTHNSNQIQTMHLVRCIYTST